MIVERLTFFTRKIQKNWILNFGGNYSDNYRGHRQLWKITIIKSTLYQTPNLKPPIFIKTSQFYPNIFCTNPPSLLHFLLYHSPIQLLLQKGAAQMFYNWKRAVPSSPQRAPLSPPDWLVKCASVFCFQQLQNTRFRSHFSFFFQKKTRH